MSMTTGAPVYAQGVMLLGAPEVVVAADAFRGGDVLGRDAAGTFTPRTSPGSAGSPTASRPTATGATAENPTSP